MWITKAALEPLVIDFTNGETTETKVPAANSCPKAISLDGIFLECSARSGLCD
jgi:hypothetical protein